MLIGLLSDTHIAWPSQGLPPQIRDAFKGVDLILHAGDIWISWVLDELELIAPVLAARGDDDLESDIGGDLRVAPRQVLSLEGVTVWVTHIKPRYSLVSPSQHPYPAWFRHEPAQAEGPPDVVVFGHTHLQEIENYKGVLLVNPGSPTLPSYVPRLGTVGLLTIESGQVTARLVALE